MSKLRSVSELRARAIAVLSLNPKLREVFTEISGVNSPSASYDLAEKTARLHGFSPNEAIDIAKASRWLAILRRDYGKEEFNRVVSKSSRPRAIVAEATATINPNPRARETRGEK